ncbi:MAG: helix-turn-helix domain-containing protein [Candidatus Omnitrophica bacterium]|nr:helix-turn-helix domain-containing protein [Candidatus Omnitrophota bacterium]
MRKAKTYMDKLMEDKEFRKSFDNEYQNLCIGEQIARTRHQAHLTQSALAKRIHTTKSAISRYESADYEGYSIPLLNRIAEACEANLQVVFVAGAKNNSRVAKSHKHRGVFSCKPNKKQV